MIFCLALVVLAFSAGAKADEWNKTTVVTFSAPVEIPGVGAQVLPAGTYIFKLLDHQSDRNIVQILNEPVLAMPTELAATLVEPIKSADEPQVIALKAAPIEAVKPTGETVAMTEVVEPPPVETAALQSTELDKSLPKTASPVPLMGLIGFLSIAAGLGLSGISKRFF
jgi:hypothetical protein